MEELKRDGEFSYSSTQLDLNTDDTKYVQEFIEGFIDKDDVDPEYGIESQSHITILYGLHDEIPTNTLIQIALETEPISILLGKTSIFETDEYDVVKVDVISGELRKLNKRLLESLEVTNNYPIYKPHLTLSYLLKGTGQKYIGNDHFNGKLITFDRMTFSPKHLEDSFLYFGNIEN